MDVTWRDIEAAALELSAEERARLIERLLDSLDGRQDVGGPTMAVEALERRLEDAGNERQAWPMVRERLRSLLDP